MKLSRIFSSCFGAAMPKEHATAAPPERDTSPRQRASAPPGLRARKGMQRAGAVGDTAAPAATAAAGAPPRGGFQRLARAVGLGRSGMRRTSSNADHPPPAVADSMMFSLKLESGKVRVRRSVGVLSREQASQLEKSLNDKKDPVSQLTKSEASGGYAIRYKSGKTRWVGAAGAAVPLVALAQHHAVDDIVAPPPVGLIAGLAGSADSGLWRVHHGKLHQWDPVRREWLYVGMSGDGSKPVELLGRQLDGHAWARCGGELVKLGTNGNEGFNWTASAGCPVVRITASGAQLALDGEGRLLEAGETGTRAVELLLSDGRPAFDPIELGDPGKPVTRARAVDFHLAPDGKTMFLRDRSGHLYQAEFRPGGTSSGKVVARRVRNPMHDANVREGWRADALALAPLTTRASGAVALHAVFSSSSGERLTAVWDGADWKPQFHAEQPLLLVNDRGLADPPMRAVVEYRKGLWLGVSHKGQLCIKDGTRNWTPLPQAEGGPLAGLTGLKLGPAGLSDAKTIYAEQRDGEGRTQILKLEMGGSHARLPARPGGSAGVLPAQEHVSHVTPLVRTAQPMRDFAVDGSDVVYQVGHDGRVMRTGVRAGVEPLPALPGRASVEQIAVSGDGNQLFALARGPLRHGDNPSMPTLFRYDAASASWVNCRINVSWDEPLHLSTSNLGTLLLTATKRDGTRTVNRVLPPVGKDVGYRLQAMVPGEKTVGEALSGTHAKRVRIPGTGAFATVTPIAAGVTDWGKGRFRAALGHAERVLSMPQGAAARIREHKHGRDDMASEYSAMQAVHERVSGLLSSHDTIPLPRVAYASEFAAPPVSAADRQTCASLREDALAGMLAELHRIGVRSGVLGPDLRVTAAAAKRKQTVKAAGGDGNDLLPRMDDWFSDMAARAHAVSRGGVGASGADPIFSNAELGRMAEVGALMRQLREHGVTLPAADMAARRDMGSDIAILTGAVGRHLDTFAHATALVTQAPPNSDAQGLAPSAGVSEAAQTLKAQVASDKVLRLARFGFAGWEEAEAHWEVVKNFRTEVAKPRAPLARKLKESLAIHDTRQRDEMAVKLAEAMKGLSNRSTLFGIESRGASVGATVSGAVFTRAGAWGFATLGIDRTTMIGVERTADQLSEGPLVAFFVRQSVKSGSAGSGFGFDFKPIDTVLGTRVQGQVQGGASLMHGKGAAMLVTPDKIDEFCRRLCDPDEDPGRILELGINEGAIGLDMREKQVSVGVSVGGLGGYADKTPAFGPPMANAAHGFQQSALQRGFAGANLTWTARDFLLKLQHAWEPISGLEYQGGRGVNASAFALLAEQGGLVPHVSEAFTLALRSLNVNLAGASVQWSGVEGFKRTLDWKTAAPVEEREWRELAALAKEVFPSQALGHFNVGAARFKETLRAVLDDARTTWGARTEHERAAFVNRAEHLLLQDEHARRGTAMLLPGAKIEFDIPSVTALEDGKSKTRAHRSLGTVMEKSVHARESVPGLTAAMQAMAKAEGTNDTRFVFQMDPSYINAVNRLMLEGTMSWEELNLLARTMPAPYRLTEICAKDSDTNRSALSVNPLPVIAFNDSAEASRSLFTAEAHLRYDLGGNIIGCDLLPSAQRAAAAQPLLQSFASEGVHPVKAPSRALPPQAPDLPKLKRSQSERPAGNEHQRASPFAAHPLERAGAREGQAISPPASGSAQPAPRRAGLLSSSRPR